MHTDHKSHPSDADLCHSGKRKQTVLKDGFQKLEIVKQVCPKKAGTG